MIKKAALLLLTAVGISFAGYAQKPCGTDEKYQQLRREHPELDQYEQQLEALIHQRMAAAKTTNAPDTTIYDIPLVVHVIHDYGVEDLTDNQIFTAVDYWASVYVGGNFAIDTPGIVQPFKKYVGNPRIRLHLATIDPNGNPTKGIVRHQSYLTNNASDQAKLDQWTPSSYINIWFVNTFTGADAGAAAYAYYPGDAQYFPWYDGVIGIYSYVNYDKAIPHEIGHVLNLEHPWGNTNQPGVACGDDGVDDTPPTKGHDPVGCVPSALYDTSCATNYAVTYTNSQGLDSVVDYPDTVNAQNIMDYTYCQLMFTNLQVQRMRTALTTYPNRTPMYSAQNLAATGALAPRPDLAPIADFSVEKGLSNIGATAERMFFLCANNAARFEFRDHSWNDTISSLQWTLSNGAGTPTSTSNVVVSTFSQPGWATISLTATSNAGSSTFSRQVFIADTNAKMPGSYTESFSDADTAQWPMFNYYNNQFQWSVYHGAGYDDQSCLQYRSYDDRQSPANKTGTPVGDYDDVFTPGFDLSGIATSSPAYLNFYTSGARISGGSTPDTLVIYASTTCGTAWTAMTTIAGSALVNQGVKSSEYIPTSQSQWSAQTIAIPAAYRSNKTFFRFRYKPGDEGNNMYMDKFSISGFPTEVSEVLNTPGLFKIYPNPSSNGTNIVFKAGQDGRIIYTIKDVTGKAIYEKEGNYSSGMPTQEFLPRSLFPAVGIYFVTLTSEGKSATEKLVVY